MKAALGFSELNEDRFIKLLGDVMKHVKKLQNNPSKDLIPQEDLVGDCVLEILSPYSEENGGVLKIQRVSFHEGRNNIIIEYPGTTDKVLSFVGSHMDVVPANPDEWEKNPFELIHEGDMLYGRGTTDCLGHVCLITDLLAQLAEHKPKLETGLIAVFIASEEDSSIPGIGVDELQRQGYLDKLKNGPLIWVDSADSQPCIGTAGVIPWKVTATGKKGHSGLPFNAVNALNLAYEATAAIIEKFHAAFPAKPEEAEWNFMCPSTMKMTKWSAPAGSLNQIPGSATIEGDIRLTPFYKPADAAEAVQRFAKEINASITELPAHGPVMSYEIEGTRGSIELSVPSEFYPGVACDIKSPGFAALNQATKEILGDSKPYSITGSLPLIGDLKEAGYDVQIVGYGKSEAYHAINEYAKLSDLKKGFQILGTTLVILNGSS